MNLWAIVDYLKDIRRETWKLVAVTSQDCDLRFLEKTINTSIFGFAIDELMVKLDIIGGTFHNEAEKLSSTGLKKLICAMIEYGFINTDVTKTLMVESRLIQLCQLFHKMFPATALVHKSLANCIMVRSICLTMAMMDFVDKKEEINLRCEWFLPTLQRLQPVVVSPFGVIQFLTKSMDKNALHSKRRATDGGCPMEAKKSKLDMAQ